MARPEVNQDDSWADYLVAVRRKILIAHFHADQLCLDPDASLDVVTVPVQAYFEGVLLAFIAAADQFAEGLNVRLRLCLQNPNLKDASEAMQRGTLRTRLFKWYDAPIAADVRNVRRQIAHHHYEKTPAGPRLEVAPPSGGARAYGGPRDLARYTSAVVEHLDRLDVLVTAAESRL